MSNHTKYDDVLVLPVVGLCPCGQLPEGDPKGVDVCTGGWCLATQHLRGLVSKCSCQLTALGRAHSACALFNHLGEIPFDME